jgi:hypothetical protein
MTAMGEDTVPVFLVEAISAPWRAPRRETPNLLVLPAFTQLRDVCLTIYPRLGFRQYLGFALATALRNLGVPSEMLVGQDIARSRLIPQPHASTTPFDRAHRDIGTWVPSIVQVELHGYASGTPICAAGVA